MQLYRPRHKIAHKALQWLFLRLQPFNCPRYQTDTSGYNATCATLDAVQVSTAIYYNNVYKRADHASGGGSAPTVCGSLASTTPGAPAEGSASPPVQGQPGGVSMLLTPGGWRSGTGSAVRAGGLAPSTRRGSPAAGRQGRAARNHWRLSPQLFSGFRPIANRGQQ